MQRAFTKMHGLGNDFVVFDATREPLRLSASQARQIADRRHGIGCDQILLVEPPPDAEADFSYRIFNADGSEVTQCGNGARCFARFVREQGLIDRDEIRVVTKAGGLLLILESDGQVRVNMGVPRFEPNEIPFQAEERRVDYPLEVNGQTYPVAAVNVGNPHAVLQVPNVNTAAVAALGPAIESHPDFPQQVNVGFLQVIDSTHARLRVYERGTGETPACGSGACAAMVAARQWGLLEAEAEIALPGGILRLVWAGEGEPVWMTGPATTVYQGSVDIDRLTDATGRGD